MLSESENSSPPSWSRSVIILSISSTTRRRFPPHSPTQSPNSLRFVQTSLPRSGTWVTSATLAFTRQNLCPSAEDSCKLIRFLVERLSESSKGGRIAAEPLNTKARDDSFKQSGNVNLALENSTTGILTVYQALTRYESENTQGPKKVSLLDVTAKPSKLEHLEEELELLKVVADMAVDDQHPVEFYQEQLKGKIDSKRNHLDELNSQW
ncbi:hypothetical protein TorRG33x02_037750 [Trema orientale]|uniref:Uncharacterized protein n=1 Tax=Trema orientale TaxID=63057 RepID=A0A2P5FRG0_TREOI|nr:hypothetical protein TorRG33x02_037750 [Trema orientale]